jgi:hypothetical protein
MAIALSTLRPSCTLLYDVPPSIARPLLAITKKKISHFCFGRLATAIKRLKVNMSLRIVVGDAEGAVQTADASSQAMQGK